jgi:hypothetical protein
MDAKVEAAWIAGLLSLATAVISIVLTTYTQWRNGKQQAETEREVATFRAETDRELQEMRAKTDHDLAVLRAETDRRLAEQTAALDRKRDNATARRDYKYVALKRLYTEVNPLLFRLREYCEGSVWRVRRVVRGDIKVHSDNHLRTTTQRLVAPLVLASELQRRLTAVDLRVDPAIRAQYIVSRELLWILHEGTRLAEVDPVITYRLKDTSGNIQEPRQHLTFAQLQQLVDVFTATSDDGTRRAMKLTELEDRCREPEVARALNHVESMFAAAYRSPRPVLWRVLIAQASLMCILIDLVDRVDQSSATIERILPKNVDDFAPPSDPDFKLETRAVETYLAARFSSSGLDLADCAFSAEHPS